MKRQPAKLRKLREELHYHQQMVRVDLKCAVLGMRKCREIAARMREIQRK